MVLKDKDGISVDSFRHCFVHVMSLDGQASKCWMFGFTVQNTNRTSIVSAEVIAGSIVRNSILWNTFLALTCHCIYMKDTVIRINAKVRQKVSDRSIILLRDT